MEEVRWSAAWKKTGKEGMFVLQDGCSAVQYEGWYCAVRRSVV